MLTGFTWDIEQTQLLYYKLRWVDCGVFNNTFLLGSLGCPQWYPWGLGDPSFTGVTMSSCTLRREGKNCPRTSMTSSSPHVSWPPKTGKKTTMVVKDKRGIPIPIFWPVNANVILFFCESFTLFFSWCIWTVYFFSLENAIENLPVLLMENNRAWIPSMSNWSNWGNFFILATSFLPNGGEFRQMGVNCTPPPPKNALSSGSGIIRKFAQNFTREGLTTFSKCYVITIPNIEVFGGFLVKSPNSFLKTTVAILPKEV